MDYGDAVTTLHSDEVNSDTASSETTVRLRFGKKNTS